MASHVHVSKTIAADGWKFNVTISEGDSKTEHEVHLSTDAYHSIAAGKETTPEELVRKSFEFLLEREPKESILEEFDLPLIRKYFPEYEEEIKNRL